MAALKSSFSIENILEHKSLTNRSISSVSKTNSLTATQTQTTSPSREVKCLSSCVLDNGAIPASDQQQYSTLRNLNLKTADATNITSAPSSIPIQTPFLNHIIPTASTTHFDHIYDPLATTSSSALLYQQFLNLQKSSTFIMPHIQAAAAAAATAIQGGGLPTIYCEPYNQFFNGEGFASNDSAVNTLYCNASYPGFYVPSFGIKRKGGQIRFTTQQTKSLENRFLSSKYLSPEERRHLALQLKLSDRQVKTWFQNRRAKWRRANLIKRTHFLHSSANTKLVNGCAKSSEIISSSSQELTSEEQKYISESDESDSESEGIHVQE